MAYTVTAYTVMAYTVVAYIVEVGAFGELYGCDLFMRCVQHDAYITNMLP